ncbi:transketolase family protein [Candidatus Pelagibacter bacterium nBUS_32]|jgi:transketolase|uniref:transketolase family protein n=1 Tax=Candidatus Pelagibacter bacterium nBUS_32 TaxID=3374192 RepID=UPI003EBE85EB
MRKTCLDMVYEIAKKNNKVIFVGSDLGAGVLDEFKKKIPKRFIMEGVSEQYLTGMVSGLAMEGFIPYFNTIATFLTRRNFEQNIIDLGLHNLPVRLIGNGGGLVYAPLGPTHQAIEDISIMRAIPNMMILAPCDSHEMKKIMPQTVNINGPIYIRLARGGDKIVTNKIKNIKIGKAISFGDFKDILFVTTGIMTQECLEVVEKLKLSNIKAGVLHNTTIKPFDEASLIKASKKTKLIFTVEEHMVSGGLGSTVLETLNKKNSSDITKVNRIGINNTFVKKYGSQQDLLNHCGLSAKKIFAIVIKKIHEQKT